MEKNKLIEEISKLKEQLTKKEKIISALMKRVEKGMELNSGAFSLFENNILLSKQVAKRTMELNELTNELQKERIDLSNKTIELQDANDFNESILQSLIDPLFVLDIEGKIKLVNEEVLKLFIYKNQNEVIGKDIDIFLRSSNEKSASFKQEYLKKGILRNIELFGIKSNQEKVILNLSLTVMRDFNGKSSGFVCILKDCTELKIMEKIIEEERAKSLNAAKLASLGEMAGGIAHEINNPLAIISGRVTLMKKMLDLNKLTNEKIEHGFEIIQKTILRIEKIITGLRTVSRNNDSFEKSDFKLMDIFDDVLALCSEKFKINGVELILNISNEQLNDNIFVDRIQFSQVLLNLIGNAYDAVVEKDNSWVKITYEQENGFDYIKIEDSGTGITPDIAHKMFNPFFTSKEIGKGTGLGLSISKSIIEKHNGDLFVDHQCINTCFVIELPMGNKSTRYAS